MKTTHMKHGARPTGRRLSGLLAKIGFAITLGAAALGASTAEAAGSWSSSNMTPNGRTYPTWTYTPSAAMSNGKHALAIVLHGCAQTQDDLKTWGNLTPSAENKGAVIFVPGVGNNYWSGNSTAKCWDYNGATDTAHNVADLINMTQSLLSNNSLNIDSRHVYIMGLSSGASVALDVACTAPDVFAGVSSIAGPSVGSSQYNALTDQSGIPSTNVSDALAKCKSLAGSKTTFFASQIANLAYGEKDKNAENPGCTYSSGDTKCPGQYQLASKKWVTDNAAMYQQLYGAGSLSSPANVYNNTGTTATAAVSGVTRVSLTRVLNVGHAWPAGSGQANDPNKGGVWIAQSGMNFSDYMLDWLMGNNQRAGIPSVSLSDTVSGTTINYSGSVSSQDSISSTQAQLYAWDTPSNSYKTSGSAVSLTLSSGNYSGSFNVPNNQWYEIIVTATTSTNKTGSKAVKDIKVGNPPNQWVCGTTTSSNNAHVTAGRAHDSGGYALANGSNQNMGLDNTFYMTTLAQTSQGYYIIGNCP